MNANAIKVIDGALALLADPLDWCHGGSGTAKSHLQEGSRCAFVALVHSAERANLFGPFPGGKPDPFLDARYAVEAVLGAPPGTVDMPIGRWNDTPGRTHAEVLAVLDRAKERLSHEAE